jgi:hypothetical protein
VESDWCSWWRGVVVVVRSGVLVALLKWRVLSSSRFVSKKKEQEEVTVWQASARVNTNTKKPQQLRSADDDDPRAQRHFGDEAAAQAKRGCQVAPPVFGQVTIAAKDKASGGANLLTLASRSARAEQRKMPG